jgi:hypothetical protein
VRDARRWREGGVRLTKPAANDNVANDDLGERPVVRTLARRPEATYATSANVILPLRFARRMAEWRRN